MGDLLGPEHERSIWNGPPTGRPVLLWRRLGTEVNAPAGVKRENAVDAQIGSAPGRGVCLLPAGCDRADARGAHGRFASIHARPRAGC